MALALALTGCSLSTASEPMEDVGEDDSALSAKACVGTTCQALPLPSPLVRGGLAASGSRLFWIGSGGTIASDGRPVDELQSCELPACASISRMPLLIGAKALRASKLRGVAGGVLFVGKKPGSWYESLFLSDGSSQPHEVVAQFDTQHDSFAVDASGLVVFSRDRRNDGWARSSLRACELDGLALRLPCADMSASSLNYVRSVALTPTRVIVDKNSSMASFARGTLADARAEPSWSGVVRLGLFTVGETSLTSRTSVRTRAGKVVHDTVVERVIAGDPFGVNVVGVLTGATANETSLYVATVGEGNVLATSRTGVVARIPTTKKRSATTLAKEQNARAVTVNGANVYWLDATSPDGAEEPEGVVRFLAK